MLSLIYLGYSLREKPHFSSSFSFVQIDIEERNADNYLSAGEVRLLFFKYTLH